CSFDGSASLRSSELGPPAIVATIDGTPYTITESLDNDSIPDPNVADDPLGGSFFASPSRSTAAPPEGTTSGGAADPHNLTALYTLVSEQGKKIESLESELQAHKLLFKDVMGKLVKRVKFLESKLKARGRNVILSESDNEEDEEQDVDSLIKLAKAAAFAADTSSVPADATKATEFPPSSSIHTDAFVHGNDVPTGTASDFSADPSNKGKSPMVEEDPPIKERSFRQMEEDRLGAEAARKLYEEEQAELARVQEEMKKKRQEDVINSAKYYNDDDWSDIMGQVHANKGLSADLLGPDVNEDNFAARMAAIIAERRRKFAAQRFQDKINKPMTYAQQRDYMRTFVKNQSSTIYTTDPTALDNLQAQNLRRSLKRPGAAVEQPGFKKSKSSAAPQTPVPAASHQSSTGVTPDVHQLPFIDTPPATPPHSPKVSSHPDVTHDTSVDPPVAPTPSFATSVSRSSGPRTRSQSSDAGIKTYRTRRKSLATRQMPSSEVDLNAPDTSFIKVLSDDDSDASDDDTDPLFWHIFAAWEVIPTGLGDVNALYFTDKSSKYFTYLREILPLIDRQDLSKLYGMVVKHYEVHPLAGNRMILWGDLHVLFESTTGGSSVEVWNDQQEWVIHSWKLFPFSGVHVLETFSGKILYMFADTPYPLSASLMKKMLKHKLAVEIDGIGNDMTYAVQLIQFIKNQLASCAFGWFLRSINLDVSVFVPVSILKAFKTEDLSRKLEVNYVKFQFRGGLLVPTGRYIVPAGYIVPTGRMDGGRGGVVAGWGDDDDGGVDGGDDVGCGGWMVSVAWSFAAPRSSRSHIGTHIPAMIILSSLAVVFFLLITIDGGLGVEMAAEWYYDEGGGWRLSWCGQKWWCYSGCGNGGGGGCHRGGSGGSGGVHRWIEGGLVVGVETWRLGWFRHGGKWPEFLAGISPEIMAAPEVVGEERGRC
ncbi:hypothetical protein Tco_0285902, partial [Tanacetum coccineum]